MPTAFPESTGDSAAPRKLLRSLVGTGLTAAVIAVAIALPDQAAAQPSLQDKLDKVSSQLKDAKSELSDLKDKRDDAKSDLRTAKATLAAAPESVTEAVDAVGDSRSAVDRLSALSGYGSSQSTELAEATESRDDATALIERLADDIGDEKEKVDDLADKRDSLKNKVAEAAEAKPQDDGGGDSGKDDGGGDSPSVSSDGAGAVAFAKEQLGEAYVFGATGPDTWDCSSLTQAAWAAAGENIGRVTYDQWDNMTHINRSDLRPGDLVFYNSQGHVAMYVGNGKVIHAPQAGDVVKYSDIDMMGIDGYTRP